MRHEIRTHETWPWDAEASWPLPLQVPMLLSQPQFAQNSGVAEAVAAAPQGALPPHARQLAVDLQVQCGRLSRRCRLEYCRACVDGVP